MLDKDKLVQSCVEEQKKESNIEFNFLILVYVIITLLFIIILPKIYIQNEIYYLSRDISKLNSELSILKEEKIELKQQLESIRFKHQILDTFMLE